MGRGKAWFASRRSLTPPLLRSCTSSCYQPCLGSSHLPTYRCDRTAFILGFAFIVCTLIAQIVLTLRCGRVRTITSQMFGSGLFCSQRTQQDLCCDGQEPTDSRCFCRHYHFPTRPRYLPDCPGSDTRMLVLAFQCTVRITFSLINSIIAEPFLSIPFDSFKICVYSRRGKLEISYTMISLVYGMTSPSLPRFHTVTR